MKVELFQLDEVDSTNLYAKLHASELPDGALIFARSQTAGRGRRGRLWLSPPDSSIYATLLIKQVHDPYLCGMVVGLAALKTLEELIPEGDFFIKWPNDVYAGHAKIAGILCESVSFSQGKISVVAAGVGLNVNLGEAVLNSLDQAATSMEMISGRTFNLKKVLEKLAFLVNRYYIMYLEDFAVLRLEWEKANRLIGRPVRLDSDNGRIYDGIFEALAPDGAMLLRTGDGLLHTLCCGDVRIKKECLALMKKTDDDNKSIIDSK